MTRLPSIDDVVKKVSQTMFGEKLVTNILRGQLVEAIVALALEPNWRWCASDYNSWDFDNESGLRVEVKQSAARQTWSPPAHGRIKSSFDIRERTQRWEGAIKIEEQGRYANIYVFGYHGVIDDTADHRDVRQWQFHVVATSNLPSTKTISLAVLQKLAPPVYFDNLAEKVAQISSGLGD